MLAAPIFGYLGDRFNRKFILCFCVFLWNASNFSASFVCQFWAFLIFRALFGIAQAGFTTIAPSMVSDLFKGDLRSRLLATFYFAIPVGNGLGYVIGTQLNQLTGDWRWSLRATPVIGAINVFVIFFVLRDPKRGEVEGGTHLVITSWIEDLKYLLTNKSFMCATLAFTAVAFASGVAFWWIPKLNYLGFKLHDKDVNKNTEGTIFGTVNAISGVVGLSFGYLSTFKFKKKFPPIDPVVCGMGLIFSGPLLAGSTFASPSGRILTYVSLFFAFVGMNLNWAIAMDICFAVVVPSRRAFAVGMQLFVGHGLGDAGSPYYTGLISDTLFERFNKTWNKSEDYCEFKALQYAYLLGCAVMVFGGVFFFLNAFFIVKDIEKVKEVMRQKNKEMVKK